MNSVGGRGEEEKEVTRKERQEKKKKKIEKIEETPAWGRILDHLRLVFRIDVGRVDVDITH